MAPPRVPGRPALSPELVRTRGIRVLLRDGQHRDLIQIADAWGVPPATAAYGIVAEFLARARREAVDMGPVGLRIAASSLMLTRMGVEAHLARQRRNSSSDS